MGCDVDARLVIRLRLRRLVCVGNRIEDVFSFGAVALCDAAYDGRDATREFMDAVGPLVLEYDDSVNFMDPELLNTWQQRFKAALARNSELWKQVPLKSHKNTGTQQTTHKST